MTGYKDDRVETKKGSYQVGSLPADWKRITISKNLIAFRNDVLKSNLTTDAFCDRAYNDSSLKNLTQQLLGGLQEVQIESQNTFMLDAREAMRTQFNAKLDGVPVKVDVVVLKKNGCLFDFFLVSDASTYTQAVPDFENFYQKFSYTEKN